MQLKQLQKPSILLAKLKHEHIMSGAVARASRPRPVMQCRRAPAIAMVVTTTKKAKKKEAVQEDSFGEDDLFEADDAAEN